MDEKPRICLAVESMGKKLEMEFLREKDMKRMMIWIARKLHDMSLSDLMAEIIRDLERSSEIGPFGVN